jgi:hypothetical protein
MDIDALASCTKGLSKEDGKIYTEKCGGKNTALFHSVADVKWCRKNIVYISYIVIYSIYSYQVSGRSMDVFCPHRHRTNKRFKY